MSTIDLHIHSMMSDDGEFSPQQIIAQCEAQGLTLVSITDHNSVRGVSEALLAANATQVLSGVELDCTYKERNFHLLGYDFDHSRQEFLEVERDILNQERASASKKIRLFQQATNIPINEAEVMAAANDGVVTGELIAEILLAQENASQFEILRPYLPGGLKSDMPNVRLYWDFFSEGKPAYVPIQYLALPDAIKLIQSAGGIAVLAHPGQNLAGDNTLLSGIIAEGINGIEAFSSYHSELDTVYYLSAAEQYRLLVTCGSDFHGKHKPKIKLGGHGATWTDEMLLSGISAQIFQVHDANF